MRVLGAGLICVFSPLNVRLPRHPEDFSDSTNDPWCRQGTLETERQFIIRSTLRQRLTLRDPEIARRQTEYIDPGLVSFGFSGEGEKVSLFEVNQILLTCCRLWAPGFASPP